MRTQSRQAARLLQLALAAIVLLGLALAAYLKPTVTPPADGYLLCFWNVENLFDDHLDDRSNLADEKFDAWFADHPDVLQLKLANLCEALLKMNDGKGPDIVVIAEVEGKRAAELLREALNHRLTDAELHYKYLLMEDVKVGRHIAPAIITRLPVRGDKTRGFKPRRILEGHIVVNGHDLVVMASHWTSRLTDKTGEQRIKYADQIYGTYKGMFKSNPQVDFVVCGDFNDPPDADSVVKHLHAVGDQQEVRRATYPDPLLFNLFAGKNAADGWGTIYDRGRWSIFDQVAASPGLLDGDGWTWVVDSAHTVNTLVQPGDKKQRPWRFGTEKDFDKGYSDHFPVTVRLKVQGE